MKENKKRTKKININFKGEKTMASIFPADTATKLIESITTVISDNMGIVIALLGFTIGVSLAFRLIRKYSKVKA